ncbi:MAG: hypothetical protein D6729_16485 [Deltaproteobacteria bacterium]|nr:MAG: hypothetical protein D6729_16485 [Deltaproteobacteria bacterium]
MRRSRPALPALLALLFAACSGGTLGGGGKDASVPCASKSDCPADYTCVQGTCQPDPGTGCAADGCPAHSFCDTDGRCVGSGEKACASDAACGGGFVCAAGRCVEGCLVDSDCAMGLYCNNQVGGCVACTFDSHCQDPALPFCLSAEGRCVQCNAAGTCPKEFYCDLSEGPDRYTCKEGCLQESDCTPGTTCELTTTPGRCVECTVETENVDCAAPKPYCDPDRRKCVACVLDSQCPGGDVCSPGGVCVDCLDDTACAKGAVCDQQSLTCVPGCRRDEQCPPASDPSLTKCDAARGDHGTCVQCLAHEDCPLGYECDDQGQCVEGCKRARRCPPEAPVCNLLQDRCVECLRDADCPTNLRCDLASNTCQCLDDGEQCGSSAECGNPPIDGMCFDFTWCITEVQCNGDGIWHPVTGRCGQSCNIPDIQDICPSGFTCRRVRNEQGMAGIKCVQGGACN